MREIKFRGYSKESDRWVYGYYYGGFDWADFIIEDAGFEHRVQVIHETVGQLTGLLDKNGKEIYEGDIIRVGHDRDKFKCREITSLIGDVKWNEVSLCWNVGGSILVTLSAADAFYNVEILGNIHDNPELLKTE